MICDTMQGIRSVFMQVPGCRCIYVCIWQVRYVASVQAQPLHGMCGAYNKKPVKSVNVFCHPHDYVVDYEVVNF